MIFQTPEVHLGGIVLVSKRQRISRAKWRVCGEGHVTAIIADEGTESPMHRVGGSPSNFDKGASTTDEPHDATDTPNGPRALSDDKSNASTFKCSTCRVGVQKDQKGSFGVVGTVGHALQVEASIHYPFF